VLPVSRDEVCRALGREVAPQRDRALDQLWEEERREGLVSPDLLHEAAEEALVV